MENLNGSISIKEIEYKIPQFEHNSSFLTV